jgi:hypothetical protein
MNYRTIKYILEEALCFCIETIKFVLFDPFLLLKIYFAPGGCVFLAYDYKTKNEEAEGKQVSVFADNLVPHWFLPEEEVVLPVKNRLDTEGFNTVYTEYTTRNFFVDTKNNILYLKQFDLAFFGLYGSYAIINEYVHKKHRSNYIAGAMDYLNSIKS